MTTESWERMRQTRDRMRQTRERKKEKKQQKKDRFSEKMIIICKMKEKALAELSAPLEVEVTDLLREDNID